MNYYFITGTGNGVGKAMAEILLKSKDNYVYGLSRSNKISNENFLHAKINLGNPDEVKNFKFPGFENPESVSLVNNAAIVSEVKHFGKHNPDNIINDFNVNIISPALLMNDFLKSYGKLNCTKTILNITSGAGKKAIESWSPYCASKSALNMMSEVIDLEQKLHNPENPVYVFSVNPGLVNTQMQDKLRSTPPEDFSMVGTFIEFKKNNQLAEPVFIAEKLIDVMKNPGKYEEICFNLQEFLIK